MTVASELTFRQALIAAGDSVRRSFAAHVPLYICTALVAATMVAVGLVYRLPSHLGSGFFFLGMIGEAAVLIGRRSRCASSSGFIAGERMRIRW
jgi:hypothetical protein